MQNRNHTTNRLDSMHDKIGSLTFWTINSGSQS